jgi:hypothetical protein
MSFELAAVFCQLKYPLEVLDFLGDGPSRELVFKAVLDESLTVLVSHLLHIDITYALDEILRGSVRFT